MLSLLKSIRLRALTGALALALTLDGVIDVARAESAPACATDCTSETEPTLPAPTLVQPALLSGPNFKVVPEVEIRGYMARFVVDTRFGPLSADSVDLLAVRISEIPAIETLDHASKTGAFAHALGERGLKTGSAIVNVVSHPIDAVTGLPAGVVRYLRAKIDTWGNRAQSIADRSSRRLENTGDPFQAPPGPMTAGRGGAHDDTPEAAGRKDHSWYARAASETGREAKRYLKYGEQRREMAKYLGVDPNTSNPILNEKLDALAWAAVGGNFSAGAALGEVAGTAAEVISYSGKLNQYVLEKTPEQLRDQLQHRLAALCSDEDSIRSFLHRGGFSDTLRASLVESLEALKPQAGCNELIELAATTRGEVEARYLTNALKLIQTRTPGNGGTLVVAGAALAWRTASGQLILPLPVDYLTWGNDLAGFFDQPALAASDKTVLIGGEASMAAQSQMTARGWNLALRAPYEGAPAYAFNSVATPAAGADAGRIRATTLDSPAG
jgi:hypothetical protein